MPTKVARERTKVLRGIEDTNQAILHFISKAQDTLRFCSDSSGPSATIGTKPCKEALLALKTKDVSSNYITEITQDNLPYCKQLVELTSELRHLDGIKGNFAVSQTEYLAVSNLQKVEGIPKLIYTNVKEIALG